MDNLKEFNCKLRLALEICLQKKLLSLPDMKEIEKTHNYSHDFYDFEESIETLETTEKHINNQPGEGMW